MRFRSMLSIAALFALLLPALGSQDRQAPQGSDSRAASRLARQVTHELLTLPWYGVFDWIEGTVSADGHVTLRGWVIRPSTSEDAEDRMMDIEGVTSVSNQIEVLPLSPADDRLRRSLYLALFDFDSPLFRYALGSNPSIHIIVNNGRVILKGAVLSEVERDAAGARANSVSGIFEVRNDLVIMPGADEN